MSSITLKEFNSLASTDYRLRLQHERMTVENYDDFVSALYNDLDWCINEVQKKAEYLQPDVNGEDRVSSYLQVALNAMFYSAEAKFVKGGNTDLTISSLNNQYKWIGEAKLVQGVNNRHVWGGFLQLVERYTSGEDPNGGILLYIYCPDAKSIMESYREYTMTKNEYHFLYENCKKKKIGTFYTIHKHTSSGENFKTRYIPVILHNSPKK
ncbi:hypothetical protein [Marivirga tractuosa]|nr:hypothetical protein [Marivirga tractuosa]